MVQSEAEDKLKLEIDQQQPSTPPLGIGIANFCSVQPHIFRPPDIYMESYNGIVSTSHHDDGGGGTGSQAAELDQGCRLDHFLVEPD